MLHLTTADGVSIAGEYKVRHITGDHMTLLIKAIIIVLTLAVVSIAVFWVIGVKQNKNETRALVKKIVNASSLKKSPIVNFTSLAELPKPVEQYFRNVLVDGQKLINLARFQQVGELKVDPKSKNWSQFEASYFVSKSPVAFIWNAKINIAPALHVRVRDSLIGGVGAGNVSLMSAITVDSDEDNPELNSGALYRYLAEAVWHPTALLPQSGVKWEAVDENRAIAHLTKLGISISLEFRFNNLGEITGIYTEDRFGKFGDKYIKYPWEGHFRNYREFNGVKIPTEGEVGWHLPEGWWLFWKGKIINAEFEFEYGS